MPISRSQNETTGGPRGRLRPILSLTLSALIATSPTSESNARSETKHGHRHSGSARGAFDDSKVEANPSTFDALEDVNGTAWSWRDVKDAKIGAVVDGKIVKPGDITFPTAEDALKNACGKSKKGLCANPSSHAQSFAAAGKALGFPPAVMICVIKQESGFDAKAKSPANARGLAQFLPETADEMQRLMKSNNRYQKAWERYRKDQGTVRPIGDFTNGNIISNFQEHADVQIFAEAMYFRKNLAPFEQMFALGMRGDNSTARFKQMIDFLLASYNWGPGNAKKYLSPSGVFNPPPGKMPKETRDYIKNIDKCIDDVSNAGGRYMNAR